MQKPVSGREFYVLEIHLKLIYKKKFKFSRYTYICTYIKMKNANTEYF